MKKKVLILGKLPPPYIGPATATQIILNSALQKVFHLVHLDTRTNKSLTAIGRPGIGKIFKNIALYMKMVYKSLFLRPDLVLIPISQSTAGFVKDSIFILAARFSGRKVLVHLRGSDLQNWLKKTSPLVRAYVEWVIRRCQGAIVLGSNLKYLFEKYFPGERIFVVPNGGNFHFPGKSNIDPDGKFKILYLSNLMPSKGIQDVIEAVRMLTGKERNNQDKLWLEVVGEWWDEKLRNEMMKKVEENKLPVSFHPTAEKEKKLEFLSKADVFVFPPCKPEGHPWVIVEAMAAGLPIISTDQGAIVESVIHGDNGFIVEPGNPGSIAEKIKFLIENPEKRKQMGRQSKKKYIENFTEDRMVERLSAVFEKVMAD